MCIKNGLRRLKCARFFRSDVSIGIRRFGGFDLQLKLLIRRDYDQRVDGRHGRRSAHYRRPARAVILPRRPVDHRGMENRRDVDNVRL